METYSSLPLYNSTICRLCGTDNSEGIYLYDNEGGTDLKSVINRYLPIKISDDAKLPRTICPGCHIQLASTIQFFDLIVDGQARLRELWEQEVKLQKALQREKRQLAEALEGNARISLVTDEVTGGNNILVKIFPNEPFFGADDELTLLVEGLAKPKRKRGRPRKVKPVEGGEPPPPPPPEPPMEAEYLDEPSKDDDEEDGGDDEGGRRLRRRRKPPQRFMETVAGKELDRILREEGAIDDESEFSPHEEAFAPSADDKGPSNESEENAFPVGEIIGHLQTPDGEKAEPIMALAPGRTFYRRKRSNRFMCDFCRLTFKDRTRWVRHRATHKGLRFECSEPTCFETFTSNTKLRAHQAVTQHKLSNIVSLFEEARSSEEPETKIALCGVCTAPFTSEKLLEDHILAEHAPELDTPEKMDLPQPQKGEDKDETPTENGNENPEEQEVQVLAESSTGNRAGNWVRQGKNGGKFKCNLCSRTFNHTSSLLYHKESYHNNGVRFACSKCTKTFSHRQLLQRHQMVHSESRPFTCSKCGLGFKTKSNLFNHRVVHTGVKKYSCVTCGQSFAHKTSLNLHMIWHQGIRPYKCPLCAKCFSQNGNLSEHLRIHYGEKPFKCPHCDKAFTTSSQQKLHVKRHTGERPWKCQFCMKQFLHKDTWRTHERRHTGEKPFVCSYCQRAFAEQWSLKKHIRLHTGEKPYKCNTCGKSFADCSNLTKHKKVHMVGSGQIVTWKASDLAGEEGDEELQQVIYVFNQEGEDASSSQAFTFDQQPSSEDGGMEGQVTTFMDEEGNPIRLPLPDGRSVEILSLDMETNIVQVRTSEGWTILLQLSPKHSTIDDEDLLEQIREAVAAAKPSPTGEVADPPVRASTPVKAEATPARSNSRQKKWKNIAAATLDDLQELKMDDLGKAILVPAEEGDQADQQTFSIRLDKSNSLTMPADFPMMSSNVYLITE